MRATRIRSVDCRKLILGIGNSLRGDDGVGEQVVRALEQLGVATATCRLAVSHQWLPEHVEAFANIERLIVIDASVAHFPGEIRVQRRGRQAMGLMVEARNENDFSPPGQRETRLNDLDSRFSSHEWDFHRVVKMATILGYSLPRTCIWTIGVQSLEHGESLTPVVSRSVERLVRHLFKAHVFQW